MNKIYNDLPVKDGYLSCGRLGDYSIAQKKGGMYILINLITPAISKMVVGVILNQ